MQKFALILILICCLSSCKSTKRVSEASKRTEQKINRNYVETKLANTIVSNAKAFHGVRYKYGGMTKKGMDCSGLVYIAFNKENIWLPRVSRDMARKGVAILLKYIKKGDLLFFQTDKNKNTINHVGLVINSSSRSIEFIHSTTSKGVITSTLKEPYWYHSFIEARRIL